VEFIGDDQFLLLANGQRLENSLTGQGLRISEFELHGTRMRENALLPGDDTPAKTRSSLYLLRNVTNVNLGELAWRVGLALAGLNFVLLAITVSSVNPRVGRSGNLVFALFAFVVYYNLLNVGQSWIANQKVAFATFMLAVHGGTFLLASLWLAKQHNNWGVRPLLHRFRRNAE